MISVSFSARPQCVKGHDITHTDSFQGGWRFIVVMFWGLLLLTCSAEEPFSIQCDPPQALAKATVWKSSGEITGLPKGPDLDLGFHDYLDLRLKLTRKPEQPLAISFGTSVKPGFDPARRILIPVAGLVGDGQWHSYRLDLGLVVWWRDALRDLRVELPAGATLDSISVGDLPGDVLESNPDLNCFVGDEHAAKEQLRDCQHLESKHFVFWWSKHSFQLAKEFDPVVMGRRALRMGEECYQVYCKLLGYAEPFIHNVPEKRDGKRHKINFITWYPGFWMGSQNGFGYLNVNSLGLLDEGFGNPMPHEFGHVVQGAQPGHLHGSYWESHANYLRSLRNAHFRDLFPDHHSDISRGMLDLSCFQQDQFRLIYADFRIYTVMDDFATEYGLPADIIARLWRDGTKEQMLWQKLASVLPKGVSIKDVAGEGLRHWVTLDLKAGDQMKAQLRPNPREAGHMDQATGADLKPLATRPGWWHISWGRAPMRYGYMFHELVPDREGGTINVEVRGLDLPGTGEDWRWSLVAQHEDDKPRYSPVFEPGAGTMVLKPGENRVFLVVVATPDLLDGSQHGLQHEHPLDRDDHFRRYPYELHLQGAKPRQRAAVWPLPAGHRHANGGGFVANSAKVAPSVFVGPEARVLDEAQVKGQARIEDQAVIADRAVIEDFAQVSGCAVIRDRSVVKGRARIRDHAQVRGASRLEGDVLALDSANLDGVRAKDLVIFRGCTQPWNCDLGGHAILEYDYSLDFPLSDGVQYNHVPWGGWWKDYWCGGQRKPRGLTASYRFDEPDGQIAWDEFGSLHGTMRGGPTHSVDAAHGTVLSLNGRDQWLELDESLSDSTALTIGLWFKPLGSRKDQTLIHLAVPGLDELTLVPFDAQGFPSLRLNIAGKSYKATVKQALPVNRWTHLAFTIDAQQATLRVDGRMERINLKAAFNLHAGPGRPGANLVGWDLKTGFLAGQVADVRCYQTVLSEGEMGSEQERTGALLGAFLAEKTNFDGKSIELETGLRNDRERTLSAMIKPHASSGYLPVFCAHDERNRGRQGGGFGVQAGTIRVRLDGMGWWTTDVAVVPGQWQHVALTFDGQTAQLYLNGKPMAKTTYNAKDLSPKTYRLGYSQEDDNPKNKLFFAGEMRDVRIFSKALPTAQVSALVSKP